MSNRDLETLDLHELAAVAGGADTSAFYEPSQGCVFDHDRARAAVARAARTAHTARSRRALENLRFVASAPDCD